MAKVKMRGGDAPAETAPSAEVVRSSIVETEKVADDGRTIKVRKLTPRRRMQVFAFVGSELAGNQQYMSMAMIAASVVAIDGEGIPMPTSRREIEALVERLGDEGMDAAGRGVAELLGVGFSDEALISAANEDVAVAKNS